jgi:3-deoxy-D-manno-octulosonate 8-phosphate phosphatase (KDO 8-P phosphatase)
MDVDGVLTDGTVLISSDGTEAKRFSILDGLGLARLRDAGFTAVSIV